MTTCDVRLSGYEKLFSAMHNWSNHCLHHLLNVILDMISGREDILISWFVIILALLGVALLLICRMIHCEHLRLSDVNKLKLLKYSAVR